MREIKFVKRNSPNFSSTREYIGNLCNVNNIQNYEFKPYRNDEIALWVNINSKQYIVYLDYNSLGIKVLENGNVVQTFDGDIGWCNAVEYLRKMT